ncbi:uncharacterized protein J4E84_002731 [Alternaria hordeiaustralica]|uniref:uncharacterized protein n=1 Tax=Alternaria hordeiaustralica TaxID=1187925 RepID=UPI0020C5A762|nr:uncharacterized protein J4E84_002731 [Alternaria hordeiaustralica]KAI4694149.1 hypothetical protein J4E84_002731 [Alternaria hordeiaustralica]
MGGTIGNISIRGIQVEHFPVTAHALVKCCVPNGHSPFEDEYLTKEAIFDKSKVDSLFKIVATLQILWLVVSVITRKMYDLPISLLEVCTVAFATIAIATYAANWAKPKDVEVPIELPRSVTPKKGNSVLFKVLGKKANEAVSTTEFIMKSLVDRPHKITPEPEQCRDSRYVRLSWIANTLCIAEPPEPGPSFYLLPCIEALLELQTGVSKGRASISWCRNNHYCWKQLCNTKYLYKLDEAPRDSSNFVRLINFNGTSLQRPAISDTTMSLILETINNLNGTTERLENDWELIEKWVERLSSIFTLFSGSIYVVARLILLVLAFAAFRKQDQRLYIDTWARFLPNVR